MDWTDQAIVLAARKHGEGSAIVELLTSNLGRHAGLVRGASGPRMRGVLQPGNAVQATWRARLAEHLGTYSLELVSGRAALLMEEHDSVLALSSLCSVACLALPEREPHLDIYEATGHVLNLLAGGDAGVVDIAQAIVRWEYGLLGALGFGLDLSACAVTGETENLIYVSPKSGRAVSAVGAGDYADRMLALPGFMIGEAKLVTLHDACDGLALTGHFLDFHIFRPNNLHLPPARDRYIQHLTK